MPPNSGSVVTRGTCKADRGLDLLMAKEQTHRLVVSWMQLQIEKRGDMPKLMRRDPDPHGLKDEGRNLVA